MIGTYLVHGCMHLFMVQVDYRLFGTGWCMVDALVYGTGLLQFEVHVDEWLMHGSRYLVQVDWYKFIVVYFTVIVWQWFHHSTYTSGRLDGARIGGCSHLPVVVGEHRWL
jgi:hypothetical protein